MEDQKLNHIAKRYNVHNERNMDEMSGSYHAGWMAGAEYVLLALGYDFEYDSDGGIVIVSK